MCWWGPAPTSRAKASSSASKSGMLTEETRWKTVRPGRIEGGMHEADQIAPIVAVLHGCEGALAVEAPDFLQDGFQADAMLVDRPELDVRLGEGGRHRPQQRPHIFLKASCSSGSACTWRGRGLRR